MPPDYKDKITIYAYNPADWKRQTITDAEEGVLHGILVTDWDGKGREALLTASFMGVHLHRYNNGKWPRTRLVDRQSRRRGPNNGAGTSPWSARRAAAILAAIEPFHGNVAPALTSKSSSIRGKGDKWGGRTVIDDTLNDGHTLVSADLDGDGVDEVDRGLSRRP